MRSKRLPVAILSTEARCSGWGSSCRPAPRGLSTACPPGRGVGAGRVSEGRTRAGVEGVPGTTPKPIRRIASYPSVYRNEKGVAEWPQPPGRTKRPPASLGECLALGGEATGAAPRTTPEDEG